MGSSTRSKVIAVAPKFSALLSICGSLGIVIKVLMNKARRKKTMHRIMLGMSICDILSSIWYFASTWPIPANTIDTFFGDTETDTIFWAAGDFNGISCSISGFFNQFAVVAPLYNISLSVFYLLVVNYGWKDSRIKRIEWSFHVIPLGYAIITSSFAAIADLYGYVPWTCWILPSEVFDDTQELTPIQSRFRIIQWIFLFGVVWVCIIVVSIIFVILYRKMKKLEQKMLRHSNYSLASTPRPTSSNNNDTSTTDFKMCQLSDSDIVSESIPQINEDGKRDQGGDIADGDGDGDGDVDVDVDVEEVYKNTVGKSDNNDDDDGGGGGGGADIENEYKKNENEIRKCEQGEEGKDDNISKSSGVFEGNEEAEMAATAAAAAGDRKSTRDRRATTRISWIISSITSGITSSIFVDQRQSDADEGDNNNNKNDSDVSTRVAAATARNNDRVATKKSRMIAVQGLLYVGAFYVTWLFPTISRITELVAGSNYFPIQFLDAFLLPLQGFFNFFIYIRPRYLTNRKLNPNDGFLKTLRIVVFESHD